MVVEQVALHSIGHQEFVAEQSTFESINDPLGHAQHC